MKKIISIVLAAVLAMAAALPAFAAETNQVDSTAACDHSGTPVKKETVSYTTYDLSYHYKYVKTLSYCSSCGVYLGSSEELEGLYAHEHGTGTYVRSTHVGDYTGHRYIYRGTCTICNGTCEWEEQSYCRPNYCVDPY